MLNALRKKFILTIMLTVGVLLTVILGVICVYTYQNLNANLQQALVQAVEPREKNNVKLPPGGITIDSEPSDSSYLAVLTVTYRKQTGEIIKMSQDVNIEEALLQAVVQAALDNPASSGTIDEHQLVYYKSEGMNDTMLSFASRQYVTTTFTSYVLLLLSLEIMALLVVYLISRFVAKLAIAPIETVWDEQKRFIANASHELKTPLTVILANNSIVRAQGDAPVSSQSAWLDSTDEEVAHMQTLINDMLLLAQSESGAQERPFTQVAFDTLVTRVALQFEAVAYERGITMTEDIAQEITVLGDEVQLKQLVMSLMDNAVKYEAVGGTITVRLWQEKDTITLLVQNQQTVIPADDLPRLFDRFYRRNEARSADGSFGLGLSIARSIVERHGGTITVTSDEQDGTCFRVNLYSKN